MFLNVACPVHRIFNIGVYLSHITCIKDAIYDYLSEIAAFIESLRGCDMIIIGDLVILEIKLANGHGAKHAVMVENSSLLSAY